MHTFKKFTITLAITLYFSSIASASVITYDSKTIFLDSVGQQLKIQDWTTFDVNTVLDNQLVDGINYQSTSSETLVVGSPHGANWLLGYPREENRYASFSFETISFEFMNEIQTFGISLSQGNQNQGNRYIGSTLWSIVVDGIDQYFSIAEYGLGDFSGESFLGLEGLEGATWVDVSRLSSTAPIVWNIRDISYGSSAPVPEPSTFLLLGGGLAGLAFAVRRRKKE